MTNTKTFATTSITACTLNPNTFHGREAYQYILNRNFFDTQRSKPAEGFYVIDWNLMGVRSVEQEFAVYNFIADEMGIGFPDESDDVDDTPVIMSDRDFIVTAFFKVEGDALTVGFYDLESNSAIQGTECLWDFRDMEDELDFRCFEIAA